MKSTQRTQALVAGISLIIMALAAGFSYGYVLSGIEEYGNPAATFEQLTTKGSLFKLSLGGWLLIFLIDIIVTFSLYLFFRETRKGLSLVTGALRLVYTAFLGMALLRLFSILPLLNEQSMNGTLAGTQVLAALLSFETIWSMGLIIFGLHLLGLGFLALLSTQIPRLFGYLLLFAGLSYVIVHSGKTLSVMTDEVVNTIEMMLMVPMALGEILLAFWLILRGGKSK